MSDTKSTASKSTTSGKHAEAKDTTPEPASTRFESPGETSYPLAGGKATASESGDPEVHSALAHLQAAQMNRDALGPPSDESVKEADEAVKAAKQRLADLGYPQK